MAKYYCHECSVKIGRLNNEVVDFNPSGNAYQLDKFYKHTIPPACSGTISTFDITCKTYKDYIVNTLASGCIEIDDQGRENVVYVAGKTTGFTYKDGTLQGDDDAVKVVLHTNDQKIHAFPTGSAELSNQKCISCGKDIVF